MRGASLAEAVIGIAIFAIFALAIVGLLGGSASISQRDGEVNQVTALAQGYLEEAIGRGRQLAGYKDLKDLPDAPTSDPAYRWGRAVQPFYGSDTPAEDDLAAMKKITVTIYKNDKAELTLSTIVNAP